MKIKTFIKFFSKNISKVACIFKKYFTVQDFIVHLWLYAITYIHTVHLYLFI